MNRHTVLIKKGYRAVVLTLGKREFLLLVYKEPFLVLTQTFDQNVAEVQFPRTGYLVVTLVGPTTVVFDLSAVPGQQEVLRLSSKFGSDLEFEKGSDGYMKFTLTGIVPAVKDKPWYTQIPLKSKKERQA